MSADDTPLSAAQRDDMRAIAAEIIPASLEFDVPGADDSAIQADILATLGRDAGLVREALDQLARLAGRPLASLDPARREAVAMELRAKGGATVAALTRRRPAMLLPRRSRRPISWTGTAAALSEGPCAGRW